VLAWAPRRNRPGHRIRRGACERSRSLNSGLMSRRLRRDRPRRRLRRGACERSQSLYSGLMSRELYAGIGRGAGSSTVSTERSERLEGHALSQAPIVPDIAELLDTRARKRRSCSTLRSCLTRARGSAGRARHCGAARYGARKRRSCSTLRSCSIRRTEAPGRARHCGAARYGARKRPVALDIAEPCSIRRTEAPVVLDIAELLDTARGSTDRARHCGGARYAHAEAPIVLDVAELLDTCVLGRADRVRRRGLTW